MESQRDSAVFIKWKSTMRLSIQIESFIRFAVRIPGMVFDQARDRSEIYFLKNCSTKIILRSAHPFVERVRIIKFILSKMFELSSNHKQAQVYSWAWVIYLIEKSSNQRVGVVCQFRSLLTVLSENKNKYDEVSSWRKTKEEIHPLVHFWTSILLYFDFVKLLTEIHILRLS